MSFYIWEFKRQQIGPCTGDLASVKPKSQCVRAECSHRAAGLILAWGHSGWALVATRENVGDLLKINVAFWFFFFSVLKANCFSKLAKPPTICKVVGKNVLDGLGLPTLQVEIFCTIQNFPKVRGSLRAFFTISWPHGIYCLNCGKLMFWNSVFVKYTHMLFIGRHTYINHESYNQS